MVVQQVFFRFVSGLSLVPILSGPNVVLGVGEGDEADQGDAVAQFNFGLMYEFGIKGVPP